MKPTQEHLTGDARQMLISIADATIYETLTAGRAQSPDLTTLCEPLTSLGASFVTLRKAGALLGCIGSMEAQRPLAIDVAENAYNAAFRDPRLPDVTLPTYERMDIKISVLTPLTPIHVTSMDDLTSKIRPNVDGLLISSPGHRGTFLPSVWKQLPRTRDFLAQLWQKAGLGPGTWPEGLTVERYETVEFGG